MQRYEVLVLTVPEVTKDELKQMENQLDRLIADEKGSTISFERWGKFRLTYPIRRNEYGVYCLMRFEGPGSLVKSIRDFFAVQLHDIAMRHVVTRLDSDTLAYQRPKSLEESSVSRDVNTFLKENQMGGLMTSREEKEAPEVVEQVVEDNSDETEADIDTEDSE